MNSKLRTVLALSLLLVVTGCAAEKAAQPKPVSDSPAEPASSESDVPRSTSDPSQEASADNPGGVDTTSNDTQRRRFELQKTDQDPYELVVYEGKSPVRTLALSKDAPGMNYVVTDTFTTEFCGQDALVVVIRYDLHAGDRAGYLYKNLVLDSDDYSMLHQVDGAEINMRDDGKVVTDDQQEQLDELRAGIRAGEACQ